ncbi:MFS transporter [Halobacillus halophilus]|uniref:MFS-type transporter n=1 Tax=Halobacillus halophilus (strain ATCC 35676 / DSM 2266 / JCM 20832 / KCTC 3685 / LMG 17431 / NBRC 102448 / NCIMB 2269) TaxID=866895 RepID=I0JT68_HALH3|nr:MFS transporter [Halobacillus halophilus]ASF41256.1 MFS transporter [Halobacillus halophilus]CCG47340.1 MFS-type transporter [Halobacillus halophilus DSM 2266]
MSSVNEATVRERTDDLQEESTPSVFKNRNFLLLWGAALLSSFGISFFLFSQSWYVVNVLNLEASLGLIYIAASIPRLLFMIISGTVADRYDKTKIMFLSDFIRGLLLAGLVLWFLFGSITLWTFVGFAFFFGILDAFFWAAESAIIPSIVQKENLTRGNSIIQMTNQTSFILAPMLAGLLIAYGNYEIVFAVTAAMLLTASLLVISMKPKKDAEMEANKNKKFWKTFREGVTYVKDSRLLTLIVLATIFLNLFIVGPMTMGLPLFVKNILEGTAVDFSFLEAGLAGGMLIGSIVIGSLNVTKKRGKLTLLTLVLSGIAFIGLSFTTELWQSMVMLGLFGTFLSISNISSISAIQSMIEEKVLGRVMGLISLASMGLIPVSYALTSAVLSLGISIHHIMAAGSILVTLFASFVFLTFKELRELD